MLISRALAAGLFAFAQSATAHSTERNPLRYVGRVENTVLHTPSHRVHALSTFELSFYLQNRRQKVRLSLAPNHDILADGASIQHMQPDGSVEIEPINRLDHRIFRGEAFVQHQGHSEWTNVGWARINVHRDGPDPIFEGAFRVDGDHHHVQTSRNYLQTRLSDDPSIEASADEYMVVWRDSDITVHDDHDELRRDLAGRAVCSSDVLSFNADDKHPVYRGLDVRDEASQLRALPSGSLFGRQIDGTTGGNGAGVNLSSTIGSTAGCPNTRKVALVGIATDCTYTAQFPSKANVTSNIIQQINTASQLYESTFNISLGIQNLTIQPSGCPPDAASSATPWNVDCKSGLTITDRLNLFSKWRGQNADTNAYWTLLSTCNTEAAVGLAWLGQVCSTGAQDSTAGGSKETIAAANVVVRTSTEWQVIAHETGHTFGAVHDCTSQTCADGTVTKQQCCPLNGDSCDAKAQFIMNPSTGGGITKFSPCSIGNICSAIGRNSVKIGCLTNNKDVVTITGSQCGNGIVETGEECDCGGSNGCGDNSCCDPGSCKFKQGAVCDPANEECCTPKCQLASGGTVCRPSTGSCDPEEKCAGDSPNCPADVTAPDGQGCGASGAGLQCASGQCTSRDLQCKTLMGSLTTGNDTYACTSQGCQLSCASPEFGSNTCLTMMQNFLDGTNCQGGGKCKNGNCDGSSVANEIGSWINDNKQIVIPVASVVGGLILLAIGCCCWSSYGKRKRSARRAQKPPAGGAPPPAGWNAYAGSYGGGGSGGNGGWGGAPMSGARDSGGGPRSVRQSRGPPGLYAGPASHMDQQGWRPVRQMSTRYA